MVLASSTKPAWNRVNFSEIIHHEIITALSSKLLHYLYTLSEKQHKNVSRLVWWKWPLILHFYITQKQSDASCQSWRWATDYSSEKLFRAKNCVLDGGMESRRHTLGQPCTRNSARARCCDFSRWRLLDGLRRLPEILWSKNSERSTDDLLKLTFSLCTSLW